MFSIRLGIPEVEEYWSNLKSKVVNKQANKTDEIKYKKLGSTFKKLSDNPKYPGLCSHEIRVLTKRYGMKVFESYIENNKPKAGRIFWVYGPDKKDITIIGIEPHPDDKSNSYEKIVLSYVERHKNTE